MSDKTILKALEGIGIPLCNGDHVNEVALLGYVTDAVKAQQERIQELERKLFDKYYEEACRWGANHSLAVEHAQKLLASKGEGE